MNAPMSMAPRVSSSAGGMPAGSAMTEETLVERTAAMGSLGNRNPAGGSYNASHEGVSGREQGLPAEEKAWSCQHRKSAANSGEKAAE